LNRLALFDCDGTLVDSQHNICTAMAEAFTRNGLAAPARAATLSVVGLSLVEAMRVLRPHAEHDHHAALAEDYKQAFQRMRVNGLTEEPLYDGIVEVLADLSAQGWLLGVATGKSDRGLALCLEAHGIAAHFVTLQTADRHPSKPHPSMVMEAMADAGATPRTTVVIGDTSYDMMMAKAAGARAIGVAWGYHDIAALEAAGAEAVAHHASAIMPLLEVR
jgi:phosphoglycolate phosphatase